MAEEFFYKATPTTLVVKKYPQIPSPLCAKGTKEQWDEFWVERDAFLFGSKFDSCQSASVDLKMLFDGPVLQRSAEENNLLFDLFVSRPRYVNCQTSRCHV